MKFGSLFAGIGGFDLGLERAGMECRWQVEIDDYCNRVLEKHWPNTKRYRDICEVFGQSLEKVDLICGGFPCQPFSCAGKRKGKDDNRYLWPEMLRVIRELYPKWVLGENVRGLLSIEGGMVFEGVCADLENEGYEVLPLVIPACAQGAPHRRDRVWIVANSKCNGWKQYSRTLGGGNNLFRIGESTENDENGKRFRDETSRSDRHAPNTESKQTISTKPRRFYSEFGLPNWGEHWYEVAARFCRVDDGVPNRVDRLKCLGNAVVPQIVEILGRAILFVEGI